MKSQDRETLLDKLIDLMSLHRHDSYDMRGLPFVNEDGSFGLTAGNKNGGFHAAYHLLDKLEEGGLLSGGKPKTDLDTAIYTLRPGMVFEVYDGAQLFRSDDENEITVQISARPFADVMAALDKGIEAAMAEKRRSAKSEMKYRAERMADRAREKRPPVVSRDADDTLATAYLTMRVHDEFPNSDIRVEADILTAEEQKLLNDTRPRLRVSFNHPAGENYTRFNDFHNRLGDVFNGSCAVMPFGGDDVRNQITVSGNIPRLAADILEHDAKGARRVLGLLKGKGMLDAADVAAYTAHIDRFDTVKSEVTGITEGISQPLKVGATLKIKAQP